MVATKFTITALVAVLGFGLLPVSASAQDRDGYRGGYDGQYRQDGRDVDYGRRQQARDGYGGEYARQGYYSQPGYQSQQGYYPQQGYQNQQDYYAQQGYGGSYVQRRPQAYGAGYGYQQRGRYRQDYGYRCGNSNTGTIVGAIAGGLIGNSVAGRGDRTLGMILGGGVGALAGSAIDRNNRRC